MLAAGVALAAYLVSVRNSDSTATTGALPTVGPDDPDRRADARADDRTTAAALAPVTLSGVTSYDPQGDDSERQDLTPRAIDSNPASYWSTETYKGSENDLAGKGGVGLVLDAGQAVTARQLRVGHARARLDGRGLRDALRDDPAQPDGMEAGVRPVHA